MNNKLKQWLLDRDLTNKWLARQLSVAGTTVSYWTRGITKPDGRNRRNLDKLMAKYDKTFERN